MFNDLNNATKEEHAAVDDIFAESEKSQEANATNGASMSAGEIDAQRTGLAAGAETTEEPINNKGSKWFKIIIIVIVVAIIILSAYLVYSKFFQTPSDTTTAIINSSQTESSTAEIKPEVTTSVEENVSSTTNQSTEGTIIVPLGSNSTVTSTSSDMATTSAEIATSSALLDSDNDGLTDLEEKTAGTNINVIDTDNDGLSDYEEVKIYHTNPLNPDTDSDGHSDGIEVKSGYNPNGSGKLGTTTSEVKPFSNPR